MALPALGMAVVGVVGTTICGILSATSRGLRMLPSASHCVHRDATSPSSARRMLAARAVTMAEPPPTAMTHCVPLERRYRATACTADNGLCGLTSAHMPSSRLPSGRRISASRRSSLAIERPQTITALAHPSRSSSAGSASKHPSPSNARISGVWYLA